MPKHVIATFLTVVLLSGLLLASLLGENHRIDSLVSQYLQQLDTRKLPKKCLSFGINNAELTRETCLDNNFIINLSLLERFDVLGQEFEITLRREQFWVPYFIDEVNVSIALAVKGNDEDLHFVENLFQVKRRNGQWQVVSITLDDSLLNELMAINKTTIDINKYVKVNGKVVTLSEQEIDLSAVSTKEQYLLNYSMSKLIDNL